MGPPLPATSRSVTHTEPVSVVQNAMWFDQQLAPDSVRFNITTAVRVHAPGDLDMLERALRHIVAEVPSLRATFRALDGIPKLVHATDVHVDITTIDVSGHEQEHVDQLLRDHHLRPFDTETGPLARFLVLRHSPEDHTVAFCVHHLIADLWSNALLGHLVASTYRDLMAGAPLAPIVERATYSEHVARETETLNGPKAAAAFDFWRHCFEQWQPQEVPSDRPAARDHVGIGHTLEIPLDRKLSDDVRAGAESMGVSVRSVILGTYQALLRRHSEASNIVVAEIKANRSARMAMTIGCCINQVPRSATFDATTTLADVIVAADAATRASRPHESIPFAALLHDLRPGHGTEPFFQASFAWQKTSRVIDERLASSLAIGENAAHSDVAGMVVEPVTMPIRSAPDPLSLLVVSADGQLRLSLEYQAERFDPETVSLLGDRLRILLTHFVADPDTVVDDADLVTPQERAGREAEWSAVARPFPPSQTALDLIMPHVRETPDSVAVIDAYGASTYRDIDERSSQLAARLRARGCQPGDLVGLCLDRSADVVVSMIASWKCGAGYVPMDPDFPVARLAAMTFDAEIELVMSTAATWNAILDDGVDSFTQATAPSLVDISDDHADGSIDQPVIHDPTGSDVAYAIFTSGSTGRPKGVVVEQSNVVNFVRSMCREPGISSEDIVLATTTLSFDISLLELIGPLAAGATVRMASREQVLDPVALSAALGQVSIAQATPTLWKVLIESGWSGSDSLKVLCGGEPLTLSLAEQLLDRAASAWNMYGPTETTVWSSIGELSPGATSISLGAPIDNTVLHVLDPSARQVPLGVAGELWIGGAGVARGYAGRPDLTAERFAPDPFTGGRMYRTGDVVRRRSDASLEFVGRIDSQVKLRGHRIELEEVEAVLSSQSGVLDVVVQVRELAHDDARLVAYLRATNDADPSELTPAKLRSYATTRLPDYMVPNLFVFVDSFPTTLNGKVDRSRLPDPTEARAPVKQSTDGGAVDAATLRVLEIYQEVLDNVAIGADDDFFAAGGHSIHATRIVSRLRELLGREVSLRLLFDHPTARQLAAAAQIAPQAITGARAGIATLVEPRAQFELSTSQQRMWYAQSITPGTVAYNLAGQIRIEGPVDISALERALAQLVDRHTSLRTSFHEVDGEPTARVHPRGLAAVEVRKRPQGQTVDDRLLNARAANEQAAAQPFDLSRLPLLRVTAQEIDDDDHLIGIVVHHIVCDQWSFGLLLREMTALLVSDQTGIPHQLETAARSELYAAAQNEDLTSSESQRQLKYWLEQLDGLPRVGLPSDKASDAHTDAGDSVSIPIPPELVEAVRRTAHEYRASEFMVQLAALQLFLHRTTGATDIGVGVPIANRHWRESESLVTSLVNTLVLRTRFEPTETIGELVSDIRNTTLDAYDNQDVPFEHLTQRLAQAQRRVGSAQFGVFFNVQNAPIETPDLDGFDVTFLPLRRRAAQFDFALTIDAELTNTVTAEYSTDLFDEAQVHTWLQSYCDVLDEISRPGASSSAAFAENTTQDPPAGLIESKPARPIASTRQTAAIETPKAHEPPRPGRESELADIWERALNVSGIGRHDDFFDLGGHSILAVRIFAGVRALSDRRPPMSMLFRYPTIATFAEALESEGWTTEWTSLVRISTGTTDANFFYVSPFLISTLSLHRLGQLHSEETSFFALQPQGLESDHPIHTSVEDMAAHYIREIRTVQPAGPYLIGGHCAGGWVAFEMVRQLQALGETVERLIVVDVEPPGIAPPRRQWIRFLASRLVMYAGGGRIFHALRWQFDMMRQRRTSQRESKAETKRTDLVRNVHLDAHARYAGGKIDGDLTLVRSEEWARLPDKNWHNRWSELVTGTVDNRVVPGAHARLLDGDSVEDLAHVFSGVLQR